MKQIRVFLPNESDTCSYLPEFQSRSLYVDPRIELNQEMLSLLNQKGFRRSGRVVYRPECPSCNACTPLRILTDNPELSRSQKRIMKRNRDLELRIESPIDGALHYPLYENYIIQRHADGDMYPPSFEQYQGFLLEDFDTTRFLCAYKDNQLLGVLVFDQLDDGLSSVYCFFDPEQSKRSPAMFLILSLSTISNQLDLKYNYLGYQVDGCRKMAYKSQFSPLEALIDDEWQAIQR